MGRIVIDRATNKIIEYQSGARPGTLKANAIRGGYQPNDLQEMEVTEAEYLALLAADPDTVINEEISQETALIEGRIKRNAFANAKTELESEGVVFKHI